MDDRTPSAALRDIPSVGGLIESPTACELARRHGRDLVRTVLRSILDRARRDVLAGAPAPSREAILEGLAAAILEQQRGSLRPVINATGIVLHTNLGRAPLGKAVVAAIAEAASGYCNLEYDLALGRRGERSAHAREMLRGLTGAEDALVVNNNAASLLLTLSVLAKDREVIVSRGELIEIGGSFRLPEIMAASGARMIEVGTTNRTRISDYEKAIGPDTAMIFKAHPSNYRVLGFTEAASVRELAALAKSQGLPLVVDQGSGLLRRPQHLAIPDEPDVLGLLEDGADVVAFSGDKLLGGPQAGILVGRRAWIKPLSKAPLLRALRADKLTYAALLAACSGLLQPGNVCADYNPALAFLSRTPEALKDLAESLQAALSERGVVSRVLESSGQCGGGALPGVRLPSQAVELLNPKDGIPGRASAAERLHAALMQGDSPVVCVLREGRVFLDVLAVFPSQVGALADAVASAVRAQP